MSLKQVGGLVSTPTRDILAEENGKTPERGNAPAATHSPALLSRAPAPGSAGVSCSVANGEKAHPLLRTKDSLAAVGGPKALPTGSCVARSPSALYLLVFQSLQPNVLPSEAMAEPVRARQAKGLMGSPAAGGHPRGSEGTLQGARGCRGRPVPRAQGEPLPEATEHRFLLVWEAMF